MSDADITQKLPPPAMTDRDRRDLLAAIHSARREDALSDERVTELTDLIERLAIGAKQQARRRT